MSFDIPFHLHSLKCPLCYLLVCRVYFRSPESFARFISTVHSYGDPDIVTVQELDPTDRKGKRMMDVQSLDFGSQVDSGCVKEVLKGVCGKEEGLVKDTSRPFLMPWCVKRLPYLPVGGAEQKDMLPHLLNCMKDKGKSVRAAADDCVTILWAKRLLKRKTIDRALEDLKAADLKAIKPRVDKILESTVCVCFET